MKKKILLSIITVLFISILVVGATFAYLFTSQSGNNSAVAGTSNEFNIIFTKGDELSGTLDPSNARNDDMKATANIRVANGSNRATVDVFLNVEEISSVLSNGSLKWEVEATKNGNSVTLNPTSGDFTTCTYNNNTRACQDSDKLYIVRDYLLDYVDTTFTVYIWLDQSEIVGSVADAVFNASIGAEISGEEFTGIVKIPNEYQKVEYIQSSGTQYINTGFVPNQDTKVEIDFEDLGTTTRFIFGARITYDSNNYGFLSINNQLRSDYGNNITHNYNRTINTRYLFVKDKNVDTLYYQGNIISRYIFSYTTITPNCSMYIFTVNNNGTPGNGSNNAAGATIKLYSLKIYDNSNLVRDFVPVYRKSGSVVGLYDIQNGVFYSNANNSGDDFTAGPNVS